MRYLTIGIHRSIGLPAAAGKTKSGFGPGGDCISFEGTPLARVGVYGDGSGIFVRKGFVREGGSGMGLFDYFKPVSTWKRA